MLVVNRASEIEVIKRVVCNYYGEENVFPSSGYSGLPKQVLCYFLRTCTSLKTAQIRSICQYKDTDSVSYSVGVVRNRTYTEPAVTRELNHIYKLLNQEGI